MELNGYTVQKTGDNEGVLTIDIEHAGTEYSIEFEFVESGTPPTASSPFPSADKDKYAWPAEPIPDELKFEPMTSGIVEATHNVESGLPDDVKLLSKPYSEVGSEGSTSPFLKTET